MFFQSLGSMITGFECLLRLTPDIFIDTTGASFTYPIAKYIFRCTVIAYVHYPTISKVLLLFLYDIINLFY